MRRLTKSFVLFLFVISVLGIDASGLFIYTGYLPFFAAASILGGAAVLIRHRVTNNTWIFVSVVSGVIFVLGIVLPHVETSRRKGFYVAVRSIQAGTPIADVERALSPFDSEPFRKYPDSITYSCRTSPQTVDQAIIAVEPGGLLVRSVTYSAD